MKKKLSNLLVIPFAVALSGSLSACNEESGLTLRILNSEDYIYLNDPTDPSSLPDLVNQFEEFVKEETGKKVTVVYDTSDTNETIYSELLTGKSNYDLINVSDYMAQKIVSNNLAVPLDIDSIPNYVDYASKEIKGRLDEISAVQKVYNEDTGTFEDKTVYLKDYCVGYMWGTLGLLFNPDFYGGDVDAVAEEMIYDLQSVDALWDTKYKGSISIKNSMRDTYALGILHVYEEEFAEIKALLDSKDIKVEEYQERFSNIFNRCDQENVNDVQNTLEELKANIFGLEVDSGKQDIVTKKIGINLAWSGDAVYSMDQAEDGLEVGENQSTLYYSVPELGSNLWMDTWLMPNCARTDEQYELAHMFLDFICDPENAAQNMDYTGYTSFIGGDSVIDLVRDWYDIRTYEIYEEVEVAKYTYDYYQVYSVNETEFTAVWYEDFLTDSHDVMRENEELYYFIPYENDEGEWVEEPETLEELLEQENQVMIYDEEDPEDEGTPKTYGDLTIVDDEENEIEAVDLSYFFDGTTEEYEEADYIFYSDCYLPFTYEEDGEEYQNISVGRQFFCQYPNEETIVRCAVMRDYGENNKLVMKMWEEFKSDPLPAGSVAIFVVILAAMAGFGVVVITNLLIKKHLKKVRNLNKK